MNIQTKYHGEIEIEQSHVISFPQGIPSFLEEKEFCILPFSEDTPFFILQSLQTPSLAFVMVSPFDFFEDYEVKLVDSAVQGLEIEAKEDVMVFTILTVQDPFEKTTVNLQGPIVINNRKKLGKQIIQNESRYTTKHLLFRSQTPAGKEG